MKSKRVMKSQMETEEPLNMTWTSTSIIVHACDKLFVSRIYATKYMNLATSTNMLPDWALCWILLDCMKLTFGRSINAAIRHGSLCASA